MRVAILTSRENSFPKVMAEGLRRMLLSLGVQVRVCPDGLWMIRRQPPVPATPAQAARALLRGAFLRSLRGFDAVIVTGHMPRAFMTDFMDDALVRASLPGVPIVLYDLVYLPTRGAWADWLKTGNPAMGIPTGGHFGMERYDWYLAASVVSEDPLPPGPHKLSVVGLNVCTGELFPEQNGSFTGLVDFARPDHPHERDIQIEALKAAEIPYRVLSGTYTTSQIRALYRQTAVYFIAHRESFGVPICEVQACGGYICTPRPDWVPSHWMKDPALPGPGVLTENFVVYDNDPKSLAATLTALRRTHSWPSSVRRRIFEQQPHLALGDLAALGSFLDRLQSAGIPAGDHLPETELVP
jgi:hypothetical protein